MHEARDYPVETLANVFLHNYQHFKKNMLVPALFDHAVNQRNHARVSTISRVRPDAGSSLG